MARVVQKFGGSSVADLDKIRHVARIIANSFDKGHQVAAVVSAMGKTTDGLVNMARELQPVPSGREYDMLLATGEMVSASLMAMALQGMGYKAVALNGVQAGIKTEDAYNNARILKIDRAAIEQHLNDGTIVIVTGFQGFNSRGDICTLGRGGSDTSAVSIAAAVDADRCEFYKDVAGVLTADPRIAPRAQKLDRIAYIEMMELARLGAKVLHPRAVETARHYDVPLVVRCTFDLEEPGTMVVNEAMLETDRSVSGVACDVNQARIAIANVPDQPGIAAKVFNTLAEADISVDMIIQSIGADRTHNDIAFTVGSSDVPRAKKLSEALCKEMDAREVLIDEDVAKVSIVGVGMIDRPGIAATMFNELAEAGINIKMISTSEIKISCLVNTEVAEKAVQVLHDVFFTPAGEPATVNQTVGY